MAHELVLVDRLAFVFENFASEKDLMNVVRLRSLVDASATFRKYFEGRAHCG